MRSNRVVRVVAATLLLAIGMMFLWGGIKNTASGRAPVPSGARPGDGSSGGWTSDSTRFYGPGAMLTGASLLALVPLALRQDQRFAFGPARRWYVLCLGAAAAGLVMQIIAMWSWYFR